MVSDRMQLFECDKDVVWSRCGSMLQMRCSQRVGVVKGVWLV